MKKNECLRCGHKWIPRIEGKPKSCPSCKNRLWDEVRDPLSMSSYGLMRDYKKDKVNSLK